MFSMTLLNYLRFYNSRYLRILLAPVVGAKERSQQLVRVDVLECQDRGVSILPGTG